MNLEIWTFMKIYNRPNPKLYIFMAIYNISITSHKYKDEAQSQVSRETTASKQLER